MLYCLPRVQYIMDSISVMMQRLAWLHRLQSEFVYIWSNYQEKRVWNPLAMLTHPVTFLASLMLGHGFPSTYGLDWFVFKDFTSNEIYSTIYCTPNRYPNRFSTEEIYLTTCCTELEASTLTGTTQTLSCVNSITVEWS
jgi:hypothetical protein